MNLWDHTEKLHSRYDILEKLLDGPLGFNEIVNKTGHSSKTVDKHLPELAESRAIEKNVDGLYEITQTGREMLQTLREQLNKRERFLKNHKTQLHDIFFVSGQNSITTIRTPQLMPQEIREGILQRANEGASVEVIIGLIPKGTPYTVFTSGVGGSTNLKYRY